MTIASPSSLHDQLEPGRPVDDPQRPQRPDEAEHAEDAEDLGGGAHDDRHDEVHHRRDDERAVQRVPARLEVGGLAVDETTADGLQVQCDTGGLGQVLRTLVGNEVGFRQTISFYSE